MAARLARQTSRTANQQGLVNKIAIPRPKRWLFFRSKLLAASTLTIPFPNELQDGTIYHTDGNGHPLITYAVNPLTLLAWGGSPISGYTWTPANGSTFPPGTTVDALTGIFHGNGSLVSGNYSFTMTVSDGSTTASATFPFTVTDDYVNPPASTPFEQLNVSTLALPDAKAGAGYGASLYADGVPRLTGVGLRHPERFLPGGHRLGPRGCAGNALLQRQRQHLLFSSRCP